MDIGSLLLALALALLVVAFVARPIVEQTAASRASEEALSTTADLVTQRDAVLIELRDLDFDHATGKIGDEEYAAQRARLVARGAELLRALDALPAVPEHTPSGDLDAEIERLVAARRKRAAPGDSKKPPAASGRCPSCRRPIAVNDKFCPHCGTRLAVAEAAK